MPSSTVIFNFVNLVLMAFVLRRPLATVAGLSVCVWPPPHCIYDDETGLRSPFSPRAETPIPQSATFRNEEVTITSVVIITNPYFRSDPKVENRPGQMTDAINLQPMQ